MTFRNAIASSLLVCATVTASAVAAAQKASLLILSKKDHTISIVDPTTLKVVAKAPVGDDPHEVVASDDGRTAWVSNYGYGEFHTLAVIDLVAGKALPSIEMGALTGPHGLTFANGKTWFTAEGAKVLGRIDPATGKIDMVLGTGQDRTHMIRVSADGKRIVTTNVSSGTVSLIDAVPVKAVEPAQAPPQPERTEWNETVIPVGKSSEGFDISPDGREIWVANADKGTVAVIDCGTKTLVTTIAANAIKANRLKFTPDGRYALLSAGPEVVVLDANSRTVVKRIAVGSGSEGVLIEPNGNRAFIAVSPDNTVAVLDLKTMKITGHIDAGGEPDGMAWAVRP
jgi:YVTN family beta-propeller protein